MLDYLALPVAVRLRVRDARNAGDEGGHQGHQQVSDVQATWSPEAA